MFDRCKISTSDVPRNEAGWAFHTEQASDRSLQPRYFVGVRKPCSSEKFVGKIMNLQIGWIQ